MIRYQPLEAAWVPAVAAMESQVMGTDAWNEAQVLDELPRSDRTWWAAFEVADTRKRTVNVGEAKLVGYAGGCPIRLIGVKVLRKSFWRTLPLMRAIWAQRK